jgi:hypothetical protein
MASPSGPQRKEGLRCECGKLLLEKNSETGELGVLCSRDNCCKFHPLEEINHKAAEFRNSARRRTMGYDLGKIFQEIENYIRRLSRLSGSSTVGDSDVYHMVVSIRRDSKVLPPFQHWTHKVEISTIYTDPLFDYPSAPHLECRGTGISFSEALADASAKLLGKVQFKELHLVKRS